MKKENKEKAKQKRAAERRKKELIGKLKIVGAVVAVVAVIAGIVVLANMEPVVKVENGDTVNIDYVGYIDGVEFEGGSTDGAGTDLVIGSGTYIDGFEEGIIGHTVGETFDLNLSFPDDYWNTEYAGKDVVFTVTLNEIYE